MQNLIFLAVFAVLSTSMLFTKKSAVAREKAEVEKTMVVSRCQAMLADGTQCAHQAGEGETCCWRHRGAVKAVNDTVKDAGEGGKKAWQSTKTWSSNTWSSTKSGWNKAVDVTKETFDDARVGMIELLGGKDAKKGAAPADADRPQ